jgi:CubicO group peptidase (beta-lactamase class C family)
MTTVRALAVTVAVMCLGAGSAAPAAAEPAGPDAAAIAAVVQAHVGATRLPGVAVAMIKDDRVLHLGPSSRRPTRAPRRSPCASC